MNTVMAITETAAIIVKGTAEQNKTMAFLFSYAHPENQFCSVVSFIIILLSVTDVSVVAITVSIDKISNHSKTNIHCITEVH